MIEALTQFLADKTNTNFSIELSVACPPPPPPPPLDQEDCQPDPPPSNPSMPPPSPPKPPPSPSRPCKYDSTDQGDCSPPPPPPSPPCKYVDGELGYGDSREWQLIVFQSASSDNDMVSENDLAAWLSYLNWTLSESCAATLAEAFSQAHDDGHAGISFDVWFLWNRGCVEIKEWTSAWRDCSPSPPPPSPPPPRPCKFDGSDEENCPPPSPPPPRPTKPSSPPPAPPCDAPPTSPPSTCNCSEIKTELEAKLEDMEERLANEKKLRATELAAMEERNAAALEAIRQFIRMTPPSAPPSPSRDTAAEPSAVLVPTLAPAKMGAGE